MAELNSKTQLVGHITSNNLPINVQIVATGAQGKPGVQGEPGRTPEILAIQDENGITITVDGEAIATIKDGKDGYSPVKNKDYFDGADGVSPVATVSKDGDTATIIITDKDGTTTAIVKDGSVSFENLTPEQKAELKGEPGYTPQKGIDYFDGYTPQKGIDYFDGYTPVKGVDYVDGAPGHSPEVTATKTDGVTTVKVDGESIANILDGKNGSDASVTSANVVAALGYSPKIGDYTATSAYANTDPLTALKNYRAANPSAFTRGSIIHIPRDASGGYHTYYIGSPNLNYFRALCLSYYNAPLVITNANGTWSSSTIDLDSDNKVSVIMQTVTVSNAPAGFSERDVNLASYIPSGKTFVGFAATLSGYDTQGQKPIIACGASTAKHSLWIEQAAAGTVHVRYAIFVK